MAIYSFKPSLIPTLITLVLFPLFISLGIWQLHRNQQKQQIILQLQQQLAKPPIALAQLPDNKDTWQYLSVKITGYFDNSHQFLLDNKIHQGRVGYEVITPVAVQNLPKLVLVDRGWIFGGNSRQRLPPLQPISTEQTFTGILHLSFGKSLTLASDQFATQPWPKRIQQVDFLKLEQTLAKPLYHFVVLMDPKATSGYLRDWKFLNSKPQKNLGYALQWFSFAAILLILYIVLNLRKKYELTPK